MNHAKMRHRMELLIAASSIFAILAASAQTPKRNVMKQMDRATIEGVELEYEIRGTGEPVVLVHAGVFAGWFKPLLEEPTLTGRYRVLSYHRIGYAGSSRVAGPVSIAQQAAHLRSLMRRLGIERAHIVGHSSGGNIALQLALDAPEVVGSLALLEPALVASPSGPQKDGAAIGSTFQIGQVLKLYEELVLSQIKRLFESLDKVERLKNWPNVISLGERILASLPDHLPEYQTPRSKTAAAYVKRWARCFDESLQDLLGYVQIKTKRNEDEKQIPEQILADLNRAIELDPEVGEYYYIRHSMRRLGNDYDYESVQARESDLARAIKLDPAIAEAVRDHQRAISDEEEEPRIPDISRPFSWTEFLAKPHKPMIIKEPWRLKCLRD
jgi:pimeloyl-ACP methyl ester carboxylesterase